MESGELSIIAANECSFVTTAAAAAFVTALGILVRSAVADFLSFPRALLLFLLPQLLLIRIAFCVDAVTS